VIAETTRRKTKEPKITGAAATMLFESETVSRTDDMSFRVSLVGVISPPSGSLGTLKFPYSLLYLFISLEIQRRLLFFYGSGFILRVFNKTEA